MNARQARTTVMRMLIAWISLALSPANATLATLEMERLVKVSQFFLNSIHFPSFGSSHPEEMKGARNWRFPIAEQVASTFRYEWMQYADRPLSCQCYMHECQWSLACKCDVGLLGEGVSSEGISLTFIEKIWSIPYFNHCSLRYMRFG